MRLHAIVACDILGGMGYRGKLPWNVPGDKHFFRQQTLRQTIIMGRKTYQSVPKALFKDRTAVVLTRQKLKSSAPHIHFVENQKRCMQVVRQTDQQRAYVIGGSEIFNLFLSQGAIDELLLSLISGTHKSDTFFPLESLKNASEKMPFHKGEGFTVFRYLFEKRIV